MSIFAAARRHVRARERVRCWPGLVLTCTTIVGALPASAIVVIHNGLAPPNPANVIASELDGEDVYVQNVGCDVTVEDPCASPGAATSVTFVTGNGPDSIHARETSTIILAGSTQPFAGDPSFVTHELATGFIRAGFTMNAFAYDESTLRVEGGGAGVIMATDDATLTVTGGLIGVGFGVTPLVASGNGVIELVGTGFTVNGAPAPYGPVAATTGTIGGTLASGDAISGLPTATFSRYDAGQIVLIAAPPVPALGMLARSALLLGLACSGTVLLEVRRSISPTRDT